MLDQCLWHEQGDSDESSRKSLVSKVLTGVGIGALAAGLVWFRLPPTEALQELQQPPQVVQQSSPVSLEMKVSPSWLCISCIDSMPRRLIVYSRCSSRVQDAILYNVTVRKYERLTHFV